MGCYPGRMHRWLSAALILASALALGRVAIAQEAGAQEGSEPESQHRLIVTVETRSDRGKVYCALWHGRQGYPTQREHAVGQERDTQLRGHRARCVFDGIEPGDGYAVAVFHDENGNNDLDRNIFGIPSEGTGASNDAYNNFGPPGYDDARFRIPDVREHRITIHIRY